jgi:class 3 adenylate cyclase
MLTCRNCSAEIRPGAKFCDQCGTQTVAGCATCGAELRPGAKFCDECGASQTQTAAVASPTPAGAKPTPVIERKVTSVLFGDLVAFTTLSEQHDKEDVRDLLSQYFTQCRRIVTRYGGTIEKFIGDAVMAVWGVPAAHEDDAERAVRAGIELVRETETLGEELNLPGLAMRVGIVTGEVAVTVGAEQEGMVAGDAVNTAARVQSVADAGHVWVDESTRLLTSDAITYVDVGSHELKGKAEPVPLWAVRAVVAAVGGAQRADGLEAPLTGRGRELRVIKELFHGVEETGRPALVLVNGDPGLGKSRLAWEFEKYIDGLSDTVVWHSTRCLAYGDGVAFWPIAEAVRGRLGLVETDQDADPATALDEWLVTSVPDASESSWLRARVLALLGRVSSGAYNRDDLFAAWQTFFERAGQGSPVAIVIDDAQHADEGTMAFVEHVLANSDTPLFVMLMTRPGLLQRWPDLATNRRATVLHLAGLESREMAALLDGLVTGLPEDVRDGLAERAQGVPLYAIETIRSLIDRDLVVPRGGVYVLPDPSVVDLAAIGAPASLHALVAARLDGLPASERRVVTDASVLGATFTREAIGVLAADVPNLDDVLTALTKAEILGIVSSRLSAEYGQYRFVQDVVRQVAYSTLSRRDRKTRHLAVAAYFETLSDPASDYAPVLAQHFLDAVESSSDSDADITDLRERAVVNLRDAAARARALGAPTDALRYLEAAIGHTVDEGTAAALHLEAAWAAFDAVDADQLETHARAAMDFYERTQDAIRLGESVAARAHGMTFFRADQRAVLDLALPHWDALQGVRGAENVLLQLARAIGAARLALGEDNTDVSMARLTIAEAIGERQALADALNSVALAALHRTPVYAAVLLRACIDISRQAQRPGQIAKGLMNLALVVAQTNLAEAHAMFDEATVETRKAGAEGFLSSVLAVNQLLLAFEMGDWTRAEQLTESMGRDEPAARFMGPWLDAALADARGRPRTITEVPDDVRASDDSSVLSYVAAADMYTAKERGDLHAAATHGTAAVLQQAAAGGLTDDLVHMWPAAFDCALAAADTDAIDKILGVLDDFPPGLIPLSFRAHRTRAAGLLAIHDGGGEAEQPLRKAIIDFEEWGSRVYAARTRCELAAWLDTQGRSDEASVLRQAAIEILEASGANGWLAELGIGAVSVVPTTTPVT